MILVILNDFAFSTTYTNKGSHYIMSVPVPSMEDLQAQQEMQERSKMEEDRRSMLLDQIMEGSARER